MATIKVTLWNENRSAKTDVYFIRAHLVQISHTIRDIDEIYADISECNTVKITQSMVKLVLDLDLKHSVSIILMKEIVKMCDYLRVPEDIMKNVGDYFAKIQKLGLLRIKINDDYFYDIQFPYAQELMLRFNALHRNQWTLDDAMGSHEVISSQFESVRIALYHALRDILDIALRLRSKDLMNMIVVWIGENAYMFTDSWIEYEDIDEDIDCTIMWNELAPTVDIHSDMSVAFWTFGQEFKDAAEKCVKRFYEVDHTSDEYYTDVGLVPIEFDREVELSEFGEFNGDVTPYRTVLFKDYQRPTKKAARKNAMTTPLDTIYDPIRGFKSPAT